MVSIINLTSGVYKTYSKPNSQTTYINVNSSHLPNIIRRLPGMILERISRSPSNKEVFDLATPYYSDALTYSGYKENIVYSRAQHIQQQQKQRRSRNIIWFNPPYSLNIRTNTARKSLNLLDKHFPRGQRLHKIFNRNTVKISYSCLPNTFNIIAAHIKTILADQHRSNEPHCNCRNRETCPLNGNCLAKHII